MLFKLPSRGDGKQAAVLVQETRVPFPSRRAQPEI